ncbi:MAG: hypothetical protein EAZ91_13120 [Cytophagales bacterium]|nr:MAG: hypothetical protein EAZ91_13120 [Cytophagales bacterium]
MRLMAGKGAYVGRGVAVVALGGVVVLCGVVVETGGVIGGITGSTGFLHPNPNSPTSASTDNKDDVFIQRMDS